MKKKNRIKKVLFWVLMFLLASLMFIAEVVLEQRINIPITIKWGGEINEQKK